MIILSRGIVPLRILRMHYRVCIAGPTDCKMSPVFRDMKTNTRIKKALRTVINNKILFEHLNIS